MVLAVTAALFGGSLAAQVTPGLSIDQVIHEPSEGDVGPYIGAQTVPNPSASVPGQPATLPCYGNGGGYHNDLDAVSADFHAIARTTTHQLAVLTNNTGADIIIDVPTIALASSRPKTDVPTAPEDAYPGAFSTPAGGQSIYGYDSVSVSVPNGSSVAVWMWVATWPASLDTSPREYILTWTFDDTVSATTMSVEVPLVVPEAGGGSDGSGCVTDGKPDRNSLLLLAMGGMAAYVTRRKLLARRRA
ncbi:MAG: hypothetical protein IT463_00560 [Planctomycetes bacterium]|nr:hypothetical protein [Planctomycetota bacterium]